MSCLRNWRRMTVAGMEGRNCRESPGTSLLPASLAYPSTPIPYPFIPPGLDSDALRKYRRTIPLSLLYVTRCSHQVSPPPLLPAIQPVPYPSRSSLLFQLFALFPRSRLARVACNLILSASRELEVGWLFLFNADYGRSLVAGIPSGDKFVRLSGASYPPCLNGYVFPPSFREERSLVINSKDLDNIYIYIYTRLGEILGP